MSIINFGKINFNWCGEYNPALTYRADDAVLFDNDFYLATANIAVDQQPPSTNWAVMVQGLAIDPATLATKAELEAVTKPPFLLIGGYGDWATTSTYPGNTWNKLQSFENILENRGGFTFEGNHTAIVPQDGVYALKCSAYTSWNDYNFTRISINDTGKVNDMEVRIYNRGQNDGISQHVWDQYARLNAGDRVCFEFYQKNPTHSNGIVYHGFLNGSLYRLGA